MNYRQVYEAKYGKVAKGIEIHHKIPQYLNGSDDIDNLEAVTRKEHAQKHLDLYNKYKDKRDLCAYYMLSGDLKMSREILGQIGGKIGGKKTSDLKLAFHGYSKEARSKFSALGGKAAQKTLKERQVSAFYDPKLRKEICHLGAIHGAFTKSNIQSELGKRGGLKNKGFIWINNSIKNIKYTVKMQKEKTVNLFLLENKDYKFGKLTYEN